MRQRHGAEIDSQRHENLDKQHHSMPFMQTQVHRIHLAESEEEHEENQPGQDRFERNEPRIKNSADEHGEPKRVTVKDRFQIFDFKCMVGHCFRNNVITKGFPIFQRFHP